MQSKNDPPPQRPPDNLPPDQLQKAWDKYLDQTMGKPDRRPNWEVTMDPRQLEILCQYLDVPEDYMRMPSSPKVELYLRALDNVLGRLPPVQASVIKRSYGIYPYEAQTQEQIAKEVIGEVRGIDKEISQQMTAKYLAWTKKNLRKLVRQEVARMVKEEVQE